MSPRRPVTGDGAAAGTAGVRDLAQLHRELHARYHSLLEKYEAAVKRLTEMSAERSRIITLAGWLVRSGGSGLALVRRGALVMTNPRWHDFTLDAHRLGGWEPLGGAPGAERRRLPDVNAVAVAEVAALHAGEPAEWIRIRRYRRELGTQVIQLRLERSDSPADEVLVAIEDVTERARMEDELDRARRALEDQERLRVVGEIASGVAHDLNNTLNALGLRIELARGDPTFGAAHGELLEKMDRIIRDSMTTARRLQDLGRVRRDRPRGAVDLGRVVAHVVEIAWAELVEKSALAGVPVTLRADLPELPAVVGIEEELRPVLMNLLLNARDAMPKGGAIEVAAGRAGDRVTLTISDEGHGIPAYHLARVFQPFFSTKGERGTGLGLSMAYALMGGLGGSITAANRPGGGAAFTLEFPLAEGAAPAVEPGSGPALAAPAHPARVLIIDDDADNREAMAELLSLVGHDAAGVSSGGAALARLRGGERFDLVLCDLGMPEMIGWEVAREVGRVAPDTPIYLLTGWALEIAENDPRRKLVRGILPKPLDVRHLAALLTPAGA